MHFENIDLFPNDKDTYLKAFISDCKLEKGRPAVLIIPGGGYCCVCDEHEGDLVARNFLASGYNTFILKYSVGKEAANFKPLIQAAAAIKYIRENAEHFNIDPSALFTCGFSAGGHLSAWIGSCYAHEKVKEALGIKDCSVCRPTGTILSYPVITAGEKAHKGSIDNLCGDENAPQEVRDLFSIEKLVTKDTAPAFIWHCFSDTCVPLENALLMAEALKKNDVPFDLHVYSEGWHGMSVSSAELYDGKNDILYDRVGSWMPLCVKWMRTLYEKR